MHTVTTGNGRWRREYEVSTEFYVYVFGTKCHVIIDAVTPAGVAYRISRTPGEKYKRKFVTTTTFLTLWKHSIPPQTTPPTPPERPYKLAV